MKKDDYGPYGEGIDGYVHYKQAFDRAQGSSGRRGRSGGSFGGCLINLVVVTLTILGIAGCMKFFEWLGQLLA